MIWMGYLELAGGGYPYHMDPVLWFQTYIDDNNNPPDPTSGRIVATTESALVSAGFSVVDTPRPDGDPYHVSIGGAQPGVIIRQGDPSWPGNRTERRERVSTLKALFTVQVWP
jgi:hypothetical protein